MGEVSPPSGSRCPCRAAGGPAAPSPLPAGISLSPLSAHRLPHLPPASPQPSVEELACRDRTDPDGYNSSSTGKKLRRRLLPTFSAVFSARLCTTVPPGPRFSLRITQVVFPSPWDACPRRPGGSCHGGARVAQEGEGLRVGTGHRP